MADESFGTRIDASNPLSREHVRKIVLAMQECYDQMGDAHGRKLAVVSLAMFLRLKGTKLLELWMKVEGMDGLVLAAKADPKVSVNIPQSIREELGELQRRAEENKP